MADIRIPKKSCYFFLFAGALILNIKRIFTDFDIDSEYAVTLAYRLVKGDRMFLQMWEPHQTSAFLEAVFIKLWLAMTGTTTGIVLFLNITGFLVKLGISIAVYFTMRKYCNFQTCFLICVFFLSVNPKMFLTLDYSNMQLYFTVLLFCCFVKYFQNTQKLYWLVLAAVFLCLTVLAYPTCVLIYLIVIPFISAESPQKKRDIFLFTVICLSAAMIYLFYFGIQIGFNRLFYCIKVIITGDPTHSAGFLEKLTSYGANFLSILFLYFLCACAGCIIVQVLRILFLRNSPQSKKPAPIKWYVHGFFIVLFGYWIKNVLTVNYQFAFIELYLPMICLALFLLKYCNREQRRLVLLGICISLGNVFATLLLTNLSLFTSLAYMILGVMVALIPIECASEKEPHRLKSKPAIGWIFCTAAILANIFIVRSMTLFYTNIFDIRNVVKSGPAIGIFSSYMGPYIMNNTLQEWTEMVRPGDNVLIVVNGGSLAGTQSLEYLFEDVNICTKDTQSSNAFNEKLLEYWSINPDKIPNVVVAESWFGELKLENDAWIKQWIDAEFGETSYVDGMYRRYYRR